MIFIELDNDRLFIGLKRKYSKEQFLRSVKTRKDTYGEEFSLMLYNVMFETAVDVSSEYKTYYSNEYPSLRECLFWRYKIPQAVVEAIVREGKKFNYMAIIEDYWWNYDQRGVFSGAIKSTLEKLEK